MVPRSVNIRTLYFTFSWLYDVRYLIYRQWAIYISNVVVFEVKAWILERDVFGLFNFITFLDKKNVEFQKRFYCLRVHE